MTKLEEFFASKRIDPKDLEEKVSSLRFEGKKIVTLNGSFDLLHAGHLAIIYEASTLGDVLIVALNSDDSIKRYKSPNRPIIPLEYRLRMMSAIAFVDYVTYFEEDDPRILLSKIRPDIHVNGAEWGANCIEAETVKAAGGKIHIAKLVPGLSTSSIVQTILKSCD